MIWILFLLLIPSRASGDFPQGDGWLKLYNYHLDEFLEIQFRTNKGYLSHALGKINHLLRSRDNHQPINIDPRLLDLLDHLQDHFKADTVEIISGYRSPDLNQNLLSEGHKVSPRSLHMQGKAIDFHLDEVREETLRDYLLRLHFGGVGYYGPLDFVHADIGPTRSWGEAPGPRKLIGILDKKSSLQITTDQNEYFENDSTVKLTLTGPLTFTALKLQRFREGKWKEVLELPQPKTNTLSYSHDLNKIGFGKFRLVFYDQNNPGTLLSSNEFYFKRK